MKRKSSGGKRRVKVPPSAGAAKLSSSWPEHFWVFAILLAVATILVYRPAWNGGFIWDDDFYVTKNPLLIAPDGLWRIWFSLDSPSQYFPLTYTTFRIERALWDLNSAGYHWINFLLHVTNALLLWRLLALLRVPGAWLAAGIFALHPIQVESVAWITERKNVLMGFFFLLTLLAWTRFVDERNRRAWRFYRLALIFYVLALCAKSTACTLPAALFLILWLQKKRIDSRRILQIVPFIVLGLAMGLIAIWWERYHQGTRGLMFTLGPLERLIVATHAAWFYLAKLFWPVKLTFIYPQWTIEPGNPLAYIWLLAGIGLCAGIYFARSYVGRSVEVAAIFFLATLSPVLGFIMLYTFRYTFVADHYQYLASIGPIALVSAGLVKLSDALRLGPRFLAAISILIFVTLGTLTWRQSASYSDIETLWHATLEKNPGCWMAENNLALRLLEQGDFDRAIVHFRKGLQLKPDYAEIHSNLASALRRKGDTDAAVAEARIGVSLAPNNPDGHGVLGMALMTKGQLDDAIAEFSKVIEIRPNHSEAHYNLAKALLDKHETAEAIAHYQKVIEAQPDHVAALTDLAWTLATSTEPSVRNGPKAVELAEKANGLTGETNPFVLRTLAAAYATNERYDNALETSRRALQFAQDQHNAEAEQAIRGEMSSYVSKAKGDVERATADITKSSQLKQEYQTHQNLAYALLHKGETDAAIAEARVAVSLAPNDPDAHGVLGMALMTKGQLDDAIAEFSKVIEIRPNHSEAHYNLAIALLDKHETAQAIAHYEKAIEAQPDHVGALTNLAWILATSADAWMRNGPKAVELAERANHLTGNTNPFVLRTLAAAYASNQRYDNALETSRRALQFAQEQHNAEAEGAIRGEMSLYEKGAPYRAQ
jgi:protein O-mannosyl-transferase